MKLTQHLHASKLIPLIIGLVALIGAPFLIADEPPKRDSYPRWGESGMVTKEELHEECSELTRWYENLRDKRRQMQSGLGDLVRKMESAEGEAKIIAMEEVITQMIDNRRELRRLRMEKRPELIRHMFTHMRAAEENPQEIGRCPVLTETDVSMGGSY